MALEDMLDWVMIGYPTRLTSNLSGAYSWLDADGQKYWHIKNSAGHPWDINTYDSTYIYHWITENADEGAWGSATAFKRSITPVPTLPRFFDLAGGTVTVTASGSNSLTRTLACESDGEALINLGATTNTLQNIGSITWGSSVGNQVTLLNEYFYGGTQREQFYYCKSFGLVKWTHATLVSGSYVIDNTTMHLTLGAGGCPTPYFPCYSSIPGPGFGGSWIGGVPGAGGNVPNPGIPLGGTGLALTAIPGFSDLSDLALEADDPALGIHVAMISNNAAFGLVRLEFFQERHKDGDTVELPVSLVDGYNYSRDELIYAWTIGQSGGFDNGWLSGPDCLWYCNWKVEQSTGEVTSNEWYRRSGHNDDATKSDDGTVRVTIIAQRQKDHLIISSAPTFQSDQSASIGIDKPWKQALAQALNRGAKFSVVRTEAMYMGEFVNGQTVPQPVSPADGYVYAYSNCIFFPSWRWTTAGGALTQPDHSLGQLQSLRMAVGNSGAVTTAVDYQAGDVIGSATPTTHGRIAVVALCSRPIP
jgi:hypothetical protein